MKKKLSLDKELVSADVAATSLDGGSLNSIDCPTWIYPTCITCMHMTCDPNRCVDITE